MGPPIEVLLLLVVVGAVALLPGESIGGPAAGLYVSGSLEDEPGGKAYLKGLESLLSQRCNRNVKAEWNYTSNITDENKLKLVQENLQMAKFRIEVWKNVTTYAWKSFKDTNAYRAYQKLSILGKDVLPEKELQEYVELTTDMEDNFGKSKIFPYKAENKENSKPTLSLEPEITQIMAKSRNYDELSYVWKAWRDVAGKPLRQKYIRFLEISNKIAKLNGFSDSSELWLEPYESKTFREDVEGLWQQLRPLYEQIHTYVRSKLITIYGEEYIKRDGPIPAHLLGNMWAQSWGNLNDVMQPYPNKPTVDVTPKMKAKNMTALQMFKISEEFFISLGLKPMTPTFWNRSIIERPKDREIICHASAWDFCDGEDFRIKQCTDITMEDLITVHHEMGHIQYYQQYAHQPNVFREGANPGFHEAIGDVLALSAATPKHLHSIGLLDEVSDDQEGDINFLLHVALDKIAFIPFGYLMDIWRWNVFSGDYSTQDLNKKWWELRLKYQGVCPPVKRDETNFDPAAKYHISANVPYIRYFVSFVIQFQFHKELCEAASHKGPLHKCDIYNSKEAGKLLSDVLKLGSSQPWQEAMKVMTRGKTDKMDASAIIEYFSPLIEWLKKQNEGQHIGWNSADPTICPGTIVV